MFTNLKLCLFSFKNWHKERKLPENLKNCGSLIFLSDFILKNKNWLFAIIFRLTNVKLHLKKLKNPLLKIDPKK